MSPLIDGSEPFKSSKIEGSEASRCGLHLRCAASGTAACSPTPAGVGEAARYRVGMPEPASWASSPAVRASMQGNRSRDTKPELKLRRTLHAMGMRYFVNRRPVRELRRTADVVFPTERVAVFVDGCFWHGCPEHHSLAKTNADYWKQKVDGNRARDIETTIALEARGWTVLRIWEHDAAEAADRVIAVVAAARSRP
jgi:DNA mismatch endonuclease (patch repair protein)